jgi:hypothetical protein
MHAKRIGCLISLLARTDVWGLGWCVHVNVPLDNSVAESIATLSFRVWLVSSTRVWLLVCPAVSQWYSRCWCRCTLGFSLLGEDVCLPLSFVLEVPIFLCTLLHLGIFGYSLFVCHLSFVQDRPAKVF